MPRARKNIPEMMLVRKWLTRTEAIVYLRTCDRDFDHLVAKHNLSISALTGFAKNLYYKVSELDAIFEANMIRKGGFIPE